MAVLYIKYRSVNIGLTNKSTLIKLSHNRVKYILNLNFIIIILGFNMGL